MTTIKHNLTVFNEVSNPLAGLIFELDAATNHFLTYSLLIIIFTVSYFIFIRRTNDITKSGVSSLHITMISALLLFYAGKVEGRVLVPDLLMLSLLILEATTIAWIYYQRQEGD